MNCFELYMKAGDLSGTDTVEKSFLMCLNKSSAGSSFAGTGIT